MAGRDVRGVITALAVTIALVATACADGSGVEAGAAVSADVATTSPAPPTSDAAPTTAPSPTTRPSPSEPSTSDGPGSTTTVPGTTVPGTTAPDGPTPGEGLGDEPFPELGNPGIDVTHYDVALTWDPDTERIAGVVTIELTTTEPRPTFSLDAEDTVEVTGVTVEGVAALFVHDVPELVVSPAQPLAAGASVEVVVTYAAVAGGDSSAAGLPGGWIANETGVYTLNEPDLARRWLPSNDHPSDKATWSFELTVPEGDIGVANGDLVPGSPATGNVWSWTLDEPMATYLVGIIIGPYEHVTGTTASGLRLSSVVLPDDLALVQPNLDEIGPMIDYFDDWFGPYPFGSYGLSVTDSVPGLAMEQQTRSLIPRELWDFGDDFQIQAFLSHELSHQWFGDAVTPASWQDIWLNEGFATYAQWMWSDHLGLQPLEDAAASGLLAGRRVNTGEPGFDLFTGEVYDGGGVVLHALRRTIGDTAFFDTLRRWVADNEGTSRTTADFIAIVESVSGQELGAFFAAWLYTTDTPNSFP